MLPYIKLAEDIINQVDPKNFFEKDRAIWDRMGFKEKVDEIYFDYEKKKKEFLKIKDEVLKEVNRMIKSVIFNCYN